LGNGDGTFQAPIEFPVGFDPEGIVTADFNGDGKLDLVVLNAQDSTFSVLLGNGDGTFQPQMTFPSPSHHYGAFQMVAADLNGDGKIDLAMEVQAGISRFLGNGDGTFQLLTTLPAALLPVSIAGADLNGDGILDLVVADQCGSDPACKSAGLVSVFLGKGDGTFLPRVDYTVGYLPAAVAIGDMNNDGIADLVVSTICGQPCNLNIREGIDNFSILLGNGDGTFQPQIAPEFPLLKAGTSSVALGDFNGDGRLDIVPGDGSDGDILLQTTLGVAGQNLTFSSQSLGSPSSPQASTLTNIAKQGPLNSSNTQITGANPADFELTTTCPGVLAPAAQCQVNTVFKPTAAGVRTATVTITDGAVGSPHTITVSGTGVAARQCCCPRRR